MKNVIRGQCRIEILGGLVSNFYEKEIKGSGQKMGFGSLSTLYSSPGNKAGSLLCGLGDTVVSVGFGLKVKKESNNNNRVMMIS